MWRIDEPIRTAIASLHAHVKENAERAWLDASQRRYRESQNLAVDPAP